MKKYDASDCLLEVYQKLFFMGKVRSRRDFAKKTGLLPATVNEIVAKRQNVTTTQIYKICTAFPEIQPNDFFKLPNKKEVNTNIINGNNNHDNVQNDLGSIKELIAEKDKQINLLIEMLAQSKGQ